MMADPDVRGEAVERVARAGYEAWRSVFGGGDHYPAPPWDDAPDDFGPKQVHRKMARTAVDALGDLLD